MTIETNFNPKKDNFSLFKKKLGTHDFEWKDVGFADCLTNDGKIDLEKFLDDCVTFDDWDDFIDFDIDFISDGLKDGNQYVIENVKEKLNLYKEFYKYDNPLIVIHDGSGDIWIEEDRFVDKYVDMDSYEWAVGVAEESE